MSRIYKLRLNPVWHSEHFMLYPYGNSGRQRVKAYYLPPKFDGNRSRNAGDPHLSPANKGTFTGWQVSAIARRADVSMSSWNRSAVPDEQLHTNSRQHLWSASQRKMIVPRYRLDSYGLRCFAVADPSTWNSLSHSVRDPALMSLSIFRHS